MYKDTANCFAGKLIATKRGMQHVYAWMILSAALPLRGVRFLRSRKAAPDCRASIRLSITPVSSPSVREQITEDGYRTMCTWTSQDQVQKNTLNTFTHTQGLNVLYCWFHLSTSAWKITLDHSNKVLSFWTRSAETEACCSGLSFYFSKQPGRRKIHLRVKFRV